MRRTLRTVPIAALAIGAGVLVLGAAPASAEAAECQTGNVCFINGGELAAQGAPGFARAGYAPYNEISNASDVDVAVSWRGTVDGMFPFGYTVDGSGTVCVRAGETTPLGQSSEWASFTLDVSVGCGG